MRSSQPTPFRAAVYWTLGILVISAGWLRAAESPGVLLPDLDRLEPAVAELIRTTAQRVEAEPTEAEAHGRLGMACEANSLWPEAEASYERAVELDREDFRWRYRLAVASRQNGSLDRSLELLQQLATEQPDLAPVRQRLALALLELGELAAARTHFERLIELEPGAPQGYTGLANVNLLEGDPEGAVSLLDSALQLRSGDRQAHYLLGLSYRALGRQEEARRELAMGLEATPAYLPVPLDFEIERLGVNLTARLDRAGTFLGLGRMEEAAQELETTLAEHPENLQVMNNLAIAYLRLDRTEDALALLERALTIDDEGFATYLNLSACYMRMGRLEDALVATDAAVARAAEVGKTHLARAGVLGAMGRFEEARASLKKVIDLEPGNLRAHLMLARVHELTEQPAEAASEFSAALELAPDDLGAWLGLARARLEIGDLEAAREALGRARELAPDHPQVIELEQRLSTEGDR